MKTKMMLAAIACSFCSFVSCNDDDNFMPEDVIVKSFESKYPGASRVEWEVKNSYKVADFYFQSFETEAWFENSGTWVLTETDLRFEHLPEAVKNALAASSYASWRVDDVDKIERPDAETVYVIEVEQGKQEVDLYYSEDGTFVKEVADGANNGYHPNTLSSTIISEITRMYPGAKIYEFEREHTNLEVDILDGKIHKEVVFNSNDEWIYTEWEIRVSEVPDVVMTALKSSEYKDYKIDDVDVYETPTGMYYRFELESGNKEIHKTFSSDGTMLTSHPV